VLYLKQSTAVTIKLGIFVDSTDGITPEESLTINQSNILLSKNSGALTQKNESSASAHDSSGYYDCDLDTTDTATAGRLQVVCNISGALPVYHEFTVLSASEYEKITSGNTGIWIS